MDDDELAEYRARHHQAYVQRLARHEATTKPSNSDGFATISAPTASHKTIGGNGPVQALWPAPKARQPTYNPSGHVTGEAVGPERIQKTRVVSEWKKPGIQQVPHLQAGQVTAADTNTQISRHARTLGAYETQVPLMPTQSPLLHAPAQTHRDPPRHPAALKASSSATTQVKPPVTSHLSSDELLARRLQEEEDQRLAQRLANEGNLDGEPRAPDDPYVERLIDNRGISNSGSPRPTVARNLLGQNAGHPPPMAMYPPPHNNLSAAQATVVGGMTRNMGRQSSLTLNSNRSTPINPADMDEDEQLRYALAQSQKDYQGSRH